MKVALRPYQDRAVNEVLAYFQRGARGVALESPVGSGKTTMGMEVVDRLIKSGKKGAWTAHRIELGDQASERADLYGIPHGRIMPGHDLTSHPFHICSIDTLSARKESLAEWLESLDFLVIDEAHHVISASWSDIARRARRAQKLALSATFYRLDGKSVNEDGILDKVVRCPGVQNLTGMGYLAPVHVYAPPTNLDLSRVKKIGGDFALGQMARAVEAAGLEIIGRRWYAEKAPGEPAIVFCPTLEQAERSAAAYRSAGWRAFSVDGTMSAKERARIVGGLADGGTQVLTSVSLLGEGFDCPAVSVVIMERPTASTGLFEQMGGRGARVHEDKSHFTILDLVGNTMRHGMWGNIRLWSLDGGLKGLERAVAATWRCRKCHRVMSKPDITAIMQCSCGATQKTSGFASAQIESHPPIAGIQADTLVRMKFQDAIENLETQSDLVAYGKLRKMEHPVAWAKTVIKSREQMRARFQPRSACR